jgi:probable addiction module antidote protein
MKTQFAPFEVADHLDNEEVIAEYLKAAAEDDNPDVLLMALADVAKARGMAQVARAAGLGRESLYKALAPGSHPRFATIQAVLRALNVRITVEPPPAPAVRPQAKKAAARAAKKQADAVQAPKRSGGKRA